MADELPPEAFARLDESDDALFYVPVRLVTHIDDSAIAALTAFYRTAIQPGAQVLDLMSSWVSHLPDDLPLGDVIDRSGFSDVATQVLANGMHGDPLVVVMGRA